MLKSTKLLSLSTTQDNKVVVRHDSLKSLEVLLYKTFRLFLFLYTIHIQPLLTTIPGEFGRDLGEILKFVKNTGGLLIDWFNKN